MEKFSRIKMGTLVKHRNLLFCKLNFLCECGWQQVPEIGANLILPTIWFFGKEKKTFFYICIIHTDLFRLCPHQYVMLPQLQSTCHYIVKALCKNIARASGGANNMHPLSWGGTQTKRSINTNNIIERVY